MAAQAEHDGNLSEEQRRHGHMIRYGDSVQLLHVSTESFLSISKTQALEKGSKAYDWYTWTKAPIIASSRCSPRSKRT